MGHKISISTEINSFYVIVSGLFRFNEKAVDEKKLQEHYCNWRHRIFNGNYAATFKYINQRYYDSYLNNIFPEIRYRESDTDHFNPKILNHLTRRECLENQEYLKGLKLPVNDETTIQCGIEHIDLYLFPHEIGIFSLKFFLEKEGAAQIVILGQTKVGRSSLLASTTNAKVEVSNYPFTTQEPVPGMLSFEDLQFQIIEARAIIRGAYEGKAWGHQTLALARNADGLILMVDLSRNPCGQLALLFNELENARILVKKPKARVEIERKHMGVGLRIIVIGKLIDCTLKEVEALLKSYKISNAIVKISGDAALDDVEDSIFESAVFRPATVVANKLDAKGAKENLRLLEKFINGRLPIIPVSCKTGAGLEKLGA